MKCLIDHPICLGSTGYLVHPYIKVKYLNITSQKKSWMWRSVLGVGLGMSFAYHFLFTIVSVHINKFAVLVLILGSDRNAIMLEPCYSSLIVLGNRDWKQQSNVHQRLDGTICQEHRTCCGKRYSYKQTLLPSSDSSYIGTFCGMVTVQFFGTLSCQATHSVDILVQNHSQF